MISERNLITSFRLAKSDIMRIQEELLNLKKQQSEIFLKLEKLIKKREKNSHSEKKKKAKKTIKKIYVASKEGNKFHNPNCPFAKNIKPKSKIIFKTKNSALNKGYKPCRCI